MIAIQSFEVSEGGLRAVYVTELHYPDDAPDRTKALLIYLAGKATVAASSVFAANQVATGPIGAPALEADPPRPPASAGLLSGPAPAPDPETGPAEAPGGAP